MFNFDEFGLSANVHGSSDFLAMNSEAVPTKLDDAVDIEANMGAASKGFATWKIICIISGCALFLAFLGLIFWFIVHKKSVNTNDAFITRIYENLNLSPEESKIMIGEKSLLSTIKISPNSQNYRELELALEHIQLIEELEKDSILFPGTSTETSKNYKKESVVGDFILLKSVHVNPDDIEIPDNIEIPNNIENITIDQLKNEIAQALNDFIRAIEDLDKPAANEIVSISRDKSVADEIDIFIKKVNTLVPETSRTIDFRK